MNNVIDLNKHSIYRNEDEDLLYIDADNRKDSSEGELQLGKYNQ